MDSPSAGISLVGPCRGPPLHRGCALGRKQVIEHQAIPVRFFSIRDVVSPFRFGVLHLLVCDVAVGSILEGVDPAIAYAVTELLLLPPQDVVGEVRLRLRFVGGVEGFA